MTLDRRHLLTLLPVLLAAGQARALSLGESNIHLSQTIENRCGVTAEHANYLAQADKILREAGYSEDERKAVLTELSCPVCGCAVAASYK
ncbi:exported hypothetical protein [Rhodospirillaceae bacterium LM-1]|nr:exported hypothetical protein [Rhodospirillaceae bacterium LM-1]